MKQPKTSRGWRTGAVGAWVAKFSKVRTRIGTMNLGYPRVGHAETRRRGGPELRELIWVSLRAPRLRDLRVSFFLSCGSWRGWLGLLWCGCGIPWGAVAAPLDGYRIDFPDLPPPIFNSTNGPSDTNAFVANSAVMVTAAGTSYVDVGRTNILSYTPKHFPTSSQKLGQQTKPTWMLVQSGFGYVVSGDKPDLYLGDALTPPTPPDGFVIDWITMTNRATTWVESAQNWALFGPGTPTNAVFLEPSVLTLYAAEGGTAMINWAYTNTSTAVGTTVPHVYTISSAPQQRPRRIFWTEPPYGAPTINLRGKYVKFRGNATITEPVIVTNYVQTLDPDGSKTNSITQGRTNVTRGLWLDQANQLHASPGTDEAVAAGGGLQGMVVMQYFQNGDYQKQVPGGVVVVEVARPEVNLITRHPIGDRLLPADNPYGTNGLVARVSQGTGNPAYVYQHQGQYTHSPNNGYVFAIRDTTQAPWNIELYWEEADFMGVVWPYERDWYAAGWPKNPQLFVRGTGDAPGTDVFLPTSLGPTLMDFQDPPGHAQLLNGGVFHTSVDGLPGTNGQFLSLLMFSGQDDQGHDNVWFQAVRSVSFDDPMFDPYRLSPLPWPIGTELLPVTDSYALAFDGMTSRAEIVGAEDATVFEQGLTNFAVGGWLQVPGAADGLLKPVLARRVEVDMLTANGVASGTTTNDLEWMLAVEPDATVSAWVRTNSPGATNAGLAVLRTTQRLTDNAWHRVAMAVESVTNPQNRTHLQVSLQIDGGLPLTTSVVLPSPRPTSPNSPLSIGTDGANAFFRGRLDDLRIESHDSSASAHRLLLDLPMTELSTDDPPQLGVGGGGLKGMVQVPVHGATLVAPGAPGLRPALADNLSTNHNYIYQTNGPGVYNPALYVAASSTNVAPASYVYGVNTGPIEVWWMESVQQPGMPTPVYFPARPQTYTNIWPIDAAPIVLASGLGAPPIPAIDPPIVYSQPDPTQVGYNPNEEHALVASGGDGWITYALRDDLNVTNATSRTPYSSEPYVLVQYEDALTGVPAMTPFRVVPTNEAYPEFKYPVVAGNQLSGPAPLNLLANLTNTYVSTGPGWRDREVTWWAVGAGAGLDGTSTVKIHNYYPKQPGFWFPGLPANRQPADGTAIPWLPSNGPGPSSDPTYPTKGTPIEVDWVVSWPPNAPTMQVGQTLTTAVNGLPDVWDQLSVDVVYQQSTNKGYPFSADHPALPAVKLFDPTIQRTSGLGADLNRLGFQFGDVNAPGYVYDRQGLTYFRGLPPDLSERFYYDPVATNLVLIGQMSVTTPSYLLVNALSPGQVLALEQLGAKFLTPENLGIWKTAVDGLRKTVVDLTPTNNVPFDHLALAAIGTGAGYVTLAFNNATNVLMGVQPGDPITLAVIRVETNLFSGFVVPLEDPLNLLSDQMNILFSESFGGEVSDFEFEWAGQIPLPNGGVPNLLTNLADFDSTIHYTNGPGVTRILLGGDGAKLEDMVDRFFVAHYRPDPKSPNYANLIKVVGTNWSMPTKWNLAEGWVQRVLNALTPFESRLRDLTQSPVETWASMPQQAGPPYEGPIALNMDAIESVGLIQLYSTVRDRALEFYTNQANPQTPPSTAANQQLLLAAGRLHALYLMLGNEAYADAMDPTIGFGSEPALSTASLPGVDFGALASSLFCFENQVPSLLDEELALLRGRGDAETAPGMGMSPFYNRLYWNFTKGIDAGEVAYAMTYNIHDSETATVSAGTAMQRYPQGHGDAWGHYLSALREYLNLLALPGFQWGEPSTLPMLLDPEFLPSVIETAPGDGQRVAEASSALVRTGVEIVRRAARKAYLADPVGRTPGSVDSDPTRAWGVTEWTARAGSMAFYTWALCQSLIPPIDLSSTNSIDASLTAISRDSVRDLDEIVAGYQTLRQQADAIDQGSNPLGMAEGTVPFDIDPAAVDGGQTHYEQIYQRALVALQNAASAFDGAQDAGRLLRQQSESALQFKRAMEDQEADYNSRLIALYGYPYPGDIGPGATYPQGYDGPDLFHYAYVGDLKALGFDPRTGIGSSLIVTNYLVTWDLLDGGGTESAIPKRTNHRVTFHLAANGMLSKPDSWVLPRRAEGQLQQAYRNYLTAVLQYQAGLSNWIGSVGTLQEAYDWYHKSDGWYRLQNKVLDDQDWVSMLNIDSSLVESAADLIAGILEVKAASTMLILEPAKESAPKAIIGGAADGGDETSTLRASFEAAKRTEAGTSAVIKVLKQGTLDAAKMVTTLAEENVKLASAKADFHIQDHGLQSSIMTQSRTVQTSTANLLVLIEAMEQAQQQFLALTAQGEQLQAERARVRTVAASHLAQGRYQDMTFRIFRNDALRRYGDAFELAARYAYLAASAYDFETCLVTSDGRSGGSVFMDQIIRARTVGRLNNGQPVVGAGIGDPGLADVLARMDANWQVLKGRLGFNNPDPETTYFSLRTDLLKILPGSDGDVAWRDWLASRSLLAFNLFENPVFRQYCLPFAAETGLESTEPGLVIPFSTSVNFGENFFGNPLAAGQNAYDSSRFATKIRGVGVWFTGYDGGTNNTDSVLARQPRVYLIPAGQDVMRSPSWDGTQRAPGGNGSRLRSWQVVDQAIPMPYPVGDELNSRDWIPIHDSLPGPWAQARRHPSIRAYQDRGFDLSELTYDSRLIGRSVWNTQWYLIIPVGTLGSNRDAALDAFTQTVKDIKLYFQTYSYSGN